MFLDINSSYPNYYSIFHIVPKLILAAGAFLGILITFSLKINIYNYVVLFYLANISLFSIFFILPRYSLSLLTIQIILSLLFLKKIKPNWQMMKKILNLSLNKAVIVFFVIVFIVLILLTLFLQINKIQYHYSQNNSINYENLKAKIFNKM